MLKTRVITAVLLLAVFVPGLFFLSQAAWGILIAIAAGVAGWEWGGLMQWESRSRRWLGGTVLLICLICLGAFPNALGIGPEPHTPEILLPAYVLATAFWFVLVPFWLHGKYRLGRGGMALCVGFVVILPAWLALVQLRMAGPWPLLAILAAVWLADIGAYFFGRNFGRHKLAVTISPGKTWEGAIGGGALVLLYGLGLRQIFAAEMMPIWQMALGLLAVTGISVVGDLFESLLKRQIGLKDSSQILPGHGGVLDRIDSLTSALPLVALLWLVLAA